MIGPLLFRKILSLTAAAGVFPGGAYILSAALLCASLAAAPRAARMA